MAWGNAVGVASWVDKLANDDPSLTSVTVFRGHAFGPDEAAAVANALKTNTHLLELYASGHAMDAQTAGTFADALATNATLRSLCVGDDAFGDDGVRALAPGIAASASLRSIDMENKGVGDDGARALGDAIRHSGRGATLESVNLSRNPNLGEAGIVAVCDGARLAGGLTRLSLAGATLADAACAAIGRWLAASTRVDVLDLTDATFASDAGAGLLLDGLRAVAEAADEEEDEEEEEDGETEEPGRRVLRELILDGAKLGDAGAVALAGGGSARGGGLPVRCLSLIGCGIGAEGAIALARDLGAVNALNFRDNAIWDDGAKALAARASGKLKTVDVGSNGLGPVGAAAFVGLALGSTLESMSLFGNEEIGGIWELRPVLMGAIDMLRLPSSSEEPCASSMSAAFATLDIGGCGVTLGGLRTLCDCLSETPTLFPKLETLVLGGNPGCQDDEWEDFLERLRAGRVGLDAAWRAADAGENPGGGGGGGGAAAPSGEELLRRYREQERENIPPIVDEPDSY